MDIKPVKYKPNLASNSISTLMWYFVDRLNSRFWEAIYHERDHLLLQIKINQTGKYDGIEKIDIFAKRIIQLVTLQGLVFLRDAENKYLVFLKNYANRIDEILS